MPISFWRDEKTQTNAKAVLWLWLIAFTRKALQFTDDGNVPNAYWNRDNRQANLERNDPENSNSANGVRAGVRDYEF